MRFTESHQLPNDGYTLYTGTKFAAIEWTHSRIYNPSLVIDTAGGNYITVGLTNTLIKAASGQIGIASSSANSVAHMRNCLLIGYSHHFVGAKANWTANDNLFDGAGLYDHGVPITNICNAYYNCGANVLSGGTSNLTLTNLTYVAGPLSEYYQQTNFILLNRGSTSASNVGLYHFTTTVDQTKETNTAVDIGIHTVAMPKVVFIGIDSHTRGNWMNVYGSLGYSIMQDATSLPGNISINASNKADWTWGYPADERALQRPAGGGRIAACWFSSTSFDVRITQATNWPNRIAFSLLDWDGGRSERIDIKDPTTGVTLDSRLATNLYEGKYFVWDVFGDVIVSVVNTGPGSAVMSGIFFSPGALTVSDSDGDGLADYWENRAGTGIRAAGELDWLNGDTDGDGTGDGLELLQGRNPFGGILPDTGNLINLRVYTPLN